MDIVTIDGVEYMLPDSPMLIEMHNAITAGGIDATWATGPKGYVRPDDTLDDRL